MSTPLHWACYTDSETSVEFLLAWGSHVNLKEIEGYTPLHLVVKNLERQGSIRILRNLVMHGADPSIKDKRGLTPLDLLGEVRNRDLAGEAKALLVSLLL